MKLNVKTSPSPVFNSEGVRVKPSSPETQLRRTVAACLLWEDGFYESGQTIAARIADLVPKCRPTFCAAVAIEARHKMHVRHAPLLVVREMARSTPAHRHLVGKLLPDVITRADELTEFLAIYWKDGKTPISKQVKLGLRAAFNKFDEYQLSKYNRDGAVKLRDVAFLTHVKPADGDLIARLVNKDKIPTHTKGGHLVDIFGDGMRGDPAKNEGLKTPDTWETQLSAGADKKSTFQRLMHEGKLGGLAFLRNLRNMRDAGVPKSDVATYAELANFTRVLPFRFLAAARIVPEWEDAIEAGMFRAVADRPRLPGNTLVLLDKSSSMAQKLSSKSDLTRFDAAAGVAILLREICETVTIGVFNKQIASVPPRRGFALRDALGAPDGGTLLGAAINFANERIAYDRIVVLTDEESQDPVGGPRSGSLAYMVNVASTKNAVSRANGWTSITGWSEAVIDYIVELERLGAEEEA